MPVIDSMKEKGNVMEVDASGSKDDVFNACCDHLDKLMNQRKEEQKMQEQKADDNDPVVPAEPHANAMYETEEQKQMERNVEAVVENQDAQAVQEEVKEVVENQEANQEGEAAPQEE